MVSFPHCKINLGLNVIAKRPDGFHDIETCFYPVPWTDILEIVPSPKMQFTATGLTIPGQSLDNLCLKAYHLLKKDFDVPPVHIHLHKLLPTGAGLGGGSSDGAFTLKSINEIFSLGLSLNQLATYASILGSDCAFFVHDHAMMGTGRGELLTSVDVSLKGKFMVIVKPDVHVSTAEAYAGVVAKKSQWPIKEVVETKPLEAWGEYLQNDFEPSVFKKFPVIREIKKQLYQAGAVYASMSGSGASVFGIFNESIDLTAKFAGTTSWSGVL